MARPPVTPVEVWPNGASDAERSSPSEGSCGVHDYPCRHPGEDLRAPKGTPVAAPHDGWIIVSKATNKAPFSGYGPSVVLIAHDDQPDYWASRGAPHEAGREAVAWRYSLLAHLEPSSLVFDLDLAPGVMDEANYFTPPNAPETRALVAVLNAGPNANADLPFRAIYVNEGELVGYVGDAEHVHWEVRTRPLGQHASGQTIDPFLWLAHYDSLTAWGTSHLPVHTRAGFPAGPKTSSGSWVWPVALLGGAWLLSRKRTRRVRARGRRRR